MEFLPSAYAYLFETCGPWGIGLLAFLIVVFFVQIYFYTFVFGRIPRFKNKKKEGDFNKGVSAITILRSPDYHYLEEIMPKMLSQDLHDFELVIVDITGDVEYSENLSAMAEHNPRLTVTRMKYDPRFPISKKMGLNIGIKAARYENVAITEADVFPASNRWAAVMENGFKGADIVLGYCGIEKKKGLKNGLIRLDNMQQAVRWLSAAMRGKPYRGDIRNLGLTKKIYFTNNGFNHLNMNMGEDDLFIRKIATRENTHIVVVPHAIVREEAPVTVREWTARRKFYSYTRNYYPAGIRLHLGLEQWSRFLLFVAAIAVMIVLPCELKLFAAALLILRYPLVIFQMRRICKRLTERKLIRFYPFYDIFSPPAEAILVLSRRIKKSPGIWR